MTFFLQSVKDEFRKIAVLWRMCCVVVIKGDIEACKISSMLNADLLYQRFGCDAVGTGLEHDRCPVCILRADVVRLVAIQSLEPGPDVSLNVLHQMSQMNGSVGVR